MVQTRFLCARFPDCLTNSASFVRSFVLSLLFAALILPLHAEEEKPSSSPAAEKEHKEGKEKKKDDKKSGSGDEEFQFPVAEGIPIKGLKIPQYGPDGKLTMLFDAEVARKIDANHIEMENLKIDSYSEEGNKMMLELPKAIFNLDDRVLSGNNGVIVKREDFQVTGNAGEFYTKTRFAKVLGNVKMTIFNTEKLDQQ